METKQTAVYWLEDELAKNLKHIILKQDNILMESLFQQAKEMEKEQMFEFAEQVLKNTECSFTGLPFMTTGYDNIYEETYGN